MQRLKKKKKRKEKLKDRKKRNKKESFPAPFVHLNWRIEKHAYHNIHTSQKKDLTKYRMEEINKWINKQEHIFSLPSNQSLICTLNWDT